MGWLPKLPGCNPVLYNSEEVAKHKGGKCDAETGIVTLPDGSTIDSVAVSKPGSTGNSGNVYDGDRAASAALSETKSQSSTVSSSAAATKRSSLTFATRTFEGPFAARGQVPALAPRHTSSRPDSHRKRVRGASGHRPRRHGRQKS